MGRTIKNGRFCIYSGNEFKVNRDSDGNTIILKTIVFGLENAYGYGRALAVWLIDKGYLVKDVNTAISHRQAKHRGAMYRKSDSDDAEAIALATLNMLDKLPDAYPSYKQFFNDISRPTAC